MLTAKIMRLMIDISLNRKIKSEHFKNLLAIAWLDDYLNDDEKAFLAERAEELGLPSDEVQFLIKSVHRLEFAVPASDEDKQDMLADVVFISMIDGQINDNEYNLCLDVGKKIELNRKYVDHIISLTRQLWQHEK